MDKIVAQLVGIDHIVDEEDLIYTVLNRLPVD